jgi:flagella basal body P-ring formation protein FlgA
MMNGRPLGIRKTVQLMVILTLLAWATQTLLAQWGFGQAVSVPYVSGREAFVPSSNASRASGSPATLEVRGEATIVGTEVKLKQVTRWSERDAALFAPVADLTIVRLGASTPYRAIGIDEIKTTLRDAGFNLSAIHFAGSTMCTIDRGDVKVDENAALQQWIQAKEAPALTSEPLFPEPKPQPAPAIEWQHNAAPAKAPAPTTAAPVAPVAVEPEPDIAAAAPLDEAADVQRDQTSAGLTTLRQLLVADLAERLGVTIEELQIQFSPKDERILNLSEPHFTFAVEPQRAKSLGPVNWDVTLTGNGGNQRLGISATAKMWQEQVVVIKPLATKQIIRDGDVVNKRTLVDRVSDQQMLTREQVIGQQSARDLKPGAVLTARMVEAVPLARPGQFVTITLTQGNVQVKTVARAMDTGTYGQSIRVKNEATKDVYEVILTGPQTAEMNPGGATMPVGDANVASATIQ